MQIGRGARRGNKGEGFGMKKWYSAFLTGVLLLSVLAGCGQSSSPAAGGKGGSSELTVYTALEDDQLKAYVDAFIRQSG
jgi:iron(III) transport system substrate-binding protein